jgi:hypothetical protein
LGSPWSTLVRYGRKPNNCQIFGGLEGRNQVKHR